MRIVSLGGIANDETNYHLELARPYSQPSLRLERTERAGGDPLITAARREPLVMQVVAEILGGDDEDATRALREAALAAWDCETAAIRLVVCDDDGGNERYRYVVVQTPDEQSDEEGPGQLFVLTMVTHGETRWRSTTKVNLTWNATADGETLAVENPGSLPARPVYTFRPTDGKDAPGNAFRYRVFCAVTWDGRTVGHYATDVTDGQFDTATLISSGDIYVGFGQNNIALLVDGRLTRRWIAGYGGNNTKVWANLNWSYYQYDVLAEGIGSGDDVTQIAATTDISTYPRQGILQIGDERFTYTDRDDVNKLFLGVERAAKGSAAEAHNAGERINWIQHDMWLLYGGSGFWLNTYDLDGPDQYAGYGEDIYKPVFDLHNSSNASWGFGGNFGDFGQSGAENVNRPGTWVPFGLGSGALGDPYHSLQIWKPDDPAAGPSGWRLPIAHRVGGLLASGLIYNSTPGRLWQVGFSYPNNAGTLISYMTLFDPGGTDEEESFLEGTNQVSGSDEAILFEQRGAAEMFATLSSVVMNFVNPPTVKLSEPVEMYDLALRLENVTTGEDIRLTLPMTLDEQLEIDTEAHTVTLLTDDSSQYQALEKGSHRKEILPLAPGVNTLRVVEDGLTGMTVYISFETRSYS